MWLAAAFGLALGGAAALECSAEEEGLLCGLDGLPLTLLQLTDAARKLDPSLAEALAVDVLSESRQPGSHSGVIQLWFEHTDTPFPLFIKKVTARAMAHKPWADRRRTLAYARTENRFYLEFVNGYSRRGDYLAAQLERAGVHTPRIALVDDRLQEVLGDAPVHETAGDEPSPSSLARAGSLLILESAPAEEYTQESPLTEPEAAHALRAVARLHAAGWEATAMLNEASVRLQRTGGSYALGIRNPKELGELVGHWEGFVDHFSHLDPQLFSRTSVIHLGERMLRWTHWASSELSPGPTDKYATLIHGDYKAMNVMLPRDAEERGSIVSGGGVRTDGSDVAPEEPEGGSEGGSEGGGLIPRSSQCSSTLLRPASATG